MSPYTDKPTESNFTNGNLQMGENILENLWTDVSGVDFLDSQFMLTDKNWWV